jgi:hypothetical protein
MSNTKTTTTANHINPTCHQAQPLPCHILIITDRLLLTRRRRRAAEPSLAACPSRR